MAPSSGQAQGTPIAIVAACCRLPNGIRSLTALAELLETGRDGLSDVPTDRWSLSDYSTEERLDPGKTIPQRGGFIEDPFGFDANFFNISPREAEHIDPQQRLLLELAWEALEQASMPIDQLRQRRVGVYVGAHKVDYRRRLDGGEDADTATDALLSALAGRISFALGLEGPSVVIDTASSASLVALHHACRALWNGEVEAALAGGANLNLMVHSSIDSSKLGVLSPRGRCRPFSQDADGIAYSEAVALLLLMPLAEARRQRRRILGVIAGSAAAQDGAESNFAAPSEAAQARILREALKSAGVAPHEVTYVEAHATGTPLGDRIETRAIHAVYGAERGMPPCRVGSVKASLGHAQSAAGIVGVLKVLAMMQTRRVPPQLGAQLIHADIDALRPGIEICPDGAPWVAGPGGRRLAAVSAWSLSGTGAHVVLEAPPPVEEADGALSIPCLVLSARSVRALRQLGSLYAAALAGRPEVSVEAFAAHVLRSRSALPVRKSIVFKNRDHLIAELRSLKQGTTAMAAPTIGFVFSGQGAQWQGMGRALLDGEPVFARWVRDFDAALRDWVEISIENVLCHGKPAVHSSAQATQLSLTAVSVGLAQLLASWGVVPDCVVGHSLGEIVAAYVTGRIDLAALTRIVAARSTLVGSIQNKGQMLWVELSLQEAEALVAAEPRVEIATCNGPRSIVLAGTPGALGRIELGVHELDRKTRRVDMSYAAHSRQLDPILPAFREMLGEVAWQPSEVPLWSTVVGEAIGERPLDMDHWVANMRNRVLFAQALRGLIEHDGGVDVLVEIGARPILRPAIRSVLAEARRDIPVVSTLRRRETAERCLASTLGELYELGVPIQWQHLAEARGHMDLPHYPFERRRYG